MLVVFFHMELVWCADDYLGGKNFLSLGIVPLPQEEYESSILTLKAKLREDDLTIE